MSSVSQEALTSNTARAATAQYGAFPAVVAVAGYILIGFFILWAILLGDQLQRN